MSGMNSPDAGFRKRTTVTWGLIVASTAGAVGASALAYSDTAKSFSDDSTYTDSAPATGGFFENTWTTPTTTTALPGFNGAPLSPRVHTRSYGS